MENKDTELVEKEHSIEVVPDVEANKKVDDLEKRLNITVIDPTLPTVEYKVIKKYDLQPTKTFVKTITTPVTPITPVVETSNTIKNTDTSKFKKKKIQQKPIFTSPIDIAFAKQEPQRQVEVMRVLSDNSNVVKAKKEFSWLIYCFILLLVVTIICMSVYALVDAIVVFSQWNLALQNNLFPNISYLHFVEILKPTYLYQYFFTTADGKVTLGPTSDANQTLAAATTYAATTSNYSVGGFGLVSAARFLHAEGVVNASNILNSSLEHDLAWPAIIQVIYSLVGILIVVLLILVPAKKHWATFIMMIFACSFIII